nr:MAG TPA: hypothetical protein [Caudoviricetes sp.]
MVVIDFYLPYLQVHDTIKTAFWQAVDVVN